MVRVYYLIRKNQRTVNQKCMTEKAFEDFKKAIEEKKIKVFLVGFEISLV